MDLLFLVQMNFKISVKFLVCPEFYEKGKCLNKPGRKDNGFPKFAERSQKTDWRAFNRSSILDHCQVDVILQRML